MVIFLIAAKKIFLLRSDIHATFAKYNISYDECSGAFSNKGRQLMETRIEALPPETGRAIVAVSHHLAESAYWILKKQTPYLDPGQQNQG